MKVFACSYLFANGLLFCCWSFIAEGVYLRNDQNIESNQHPFENSDISGNRNLVESVSWFHARSDGGKWTETNDGLTLRYDINDNTVCDSSSSTAATNHTFVDISFADVEVQNNVVIAVNVKGRVNQQKSLDLNRRNDVLNLYVNGHWVFQTSGNNAQSAGANDCVMGEYEITRELPSEPILLKRGPSAISVEIITSGSAYHASGYYEIEFVLVPAPNTASTSIVQEVYDIVY